MNKYLSKSNAYKVCTSASLIVFLAGTVLGQDFLADSATKLQGREFTENGLSTIDSNFVRNISNQAYTPIYSSSLTAEVNNTGPFQSNSTPEQNSKAVNEPESLGRGSAAGDMEPARSLPSSINRNQDPIAPDENQAIASGSTRETIRLPDHIPTECVINAAQRYDVPEMALLAILKQESGGKLGVIGNNSDGSRDFGPAQINDKAWGSHLEKNFGITLNDVLHNACQAIMVEAYILRIAWNTCAKRNNTDIWCAIATYHSSNPYHQRIYVSSVWEHYKRMINRGEF